MHTQDTTAFHTPGWREALARMLGAQQLYTPLEYRVPSVIPSVPFRAELERQMLLSDRTSAPLTLLVFELQNDLAAPVHNERQLERLARIIVECTRRTDMKGWFRDAHGLRVALLMHYTTYENTERILSCARHLFGEVDSSGNSLLHLHVACEIYAYPVEKGETGRESGQLNLFDDTVPDEEDRKEERRTQEHRAGSSEPSEARIPPLSIEEVLVPPFPVWKRALDLALSLSALLIVSPLLFIVAVAIKLTSRGPVFYRQERVGHLGKIFRLWKFRSMRVNADSTAHKQYLSRLITSSNGEHEAPMLKLDAVNPAITPIGRILRSTCLDELPQLFNVLMGQMSLVGPRPCLPYEAKEYLLWHNRRFDTMPGITGLWQVSGKNRTTFRQMIRLDIYYARHLSPWLDIKILFLTLPAVLNEIMGSFQEEPGQAPSPAAPSSSPLRRISKNRAKENRNPVVEIDNA